MPLLKLAVGFLHVVAGLAAEGGRRTVDRVGVPFELDERAQRGLVDRGVDSGKIERRAVFLVTVERPEADALEDCLANALLRLGQFDAAIREYERILRLNPNYPLARFHLARAYEGKGRNDLALENYRLFLEIWKDADSDIPEIAAAHKALNS